MTMLQSKKRKWRLWQIEPTMACNLKCIMCPWHGHRKHMDGSGHMPQEVWNALEPSLEQVDTIDLSGTGEPLLQQSLASWLVQAKERGCNTGFLTNGTLMDEFKAREILSAGIDWIGFSMDGASRETYESIRVMACFDTVCANIKRLADLRTGKAPHIRINFVMTKINIHELESMVTLCSELGADHITFKHCDVIRDDFGLGFGVLDEIDPAKIRAMAKKLERVKKLAGEKRMGIAVFGFVPDEQPVCDQDPRTSLFISHRGDMAPCISMAYGGKTRFSGKSLAMPTLIYGNVLESAIDDTWNSFPCKSIGRTFHQRVTAYDRVFAGSDRFYSLHSLEQAFEKAAAAMPEPPAACRVCPYLYGI